MPAHPPYKRMVLLAVEAQQPKGSRALTSRHVIDKTIRRDHKVAPSHSTYLRKTLTGLVKDKDLVRIKASYRITPRGRRTLHPIPKKRKVRATTACATAPPPSAPASDAPTSISLAPSASISAPPPSAPSYSARKPATFRWQYYDPDPSKQTPLSATTSNPTFWRNYDESCNDALNGAYLFFLQGRSGSTERSRPSIHSGGYNYHVDFSTMTQTNMTHPDHTVRHVRRHFG